MIYGVTSAVSLQCSTFLNFKAVRDDTYSQTHSPERQRVRRQMFLRCLFAIFAGVSLAVNVHSWKVHDVTVVEDEYGVVGNQMVKRYTFSNGNGMTAEIITYGGRITAIKVPDACGEIRDVVLGFDNLEGLYSYLVKFVVYLATLCRLQNIYRSVIITIHGFRRVPITREQLTLLKRYLFRS
jgi:hypothetical protein